MQDTSTIFLSEKDAAKLLCCHPNTLQRYRRQGVLIESIHFGRSPGGEKILYVRPLLENLVLCGGNPQHPDHIRAIALWQSQRWENQKRRSQFGKSRSAG